MKTKLLQFLQILTEQAKDLQGAKPAPKFHKPDGVKSVDTSSANDISKKRTKKSMQTNNQSQNAVAEESFEDVLSNALADLKGNSINEDFESGAGDTGEGDDLEFGGEIDGNDDIGGGSIEDLVSQLRDLVEQIADEVGVGSGADCDDDMDDNFEGDGGADDDLNNVPTEDKGTSLGHPLKGMSRGKSLQKKGNRVPSKQNKQGSKAGTTNVNVKTGNAINNKKSDLNNKSKQKVSNSKNSSGEDLF